MPINLARWHVAVAWREDVLYRNIFIEKLREKTKVEKVKAYTLPYIIETVQESPTVTAIVDKFVNSVKQLPKLCAVFFKCIDEEITLWTVIEHLDFEIEYAICKSENKIARNRQEYAFDFLTLPRNGKLLHKVVPKDLKIVYQKSEG